MMTVREVADRYEVSTGFMVQALAKIGCLEMTPDKTLSAAIITRFESTFGEKIRAARPKPDAAPTDDVQRRAWREPTPHVMRVAYDRTAWKRNMRDMVRYQVLAEDPGPAHAIDTAGTREGDLWHGKIEPGEYSFYEHLGPHAVCGVQVKVVMGDEFVPEDEAVAAGQCPKCAELVAAGRGFRTPPHERTPYMCEDFLRVTLDGRVTVEECYLRNFHRGPHRTFDGATWVVGLGDYVPAIK